MTLSKQKGPRKNGPFCLFIFIALMIPLTLAIWYPFFVAYDHSLCKKEEAAKLAEEEA